MFTVSIVVRLIPITSSNSSLMLPEVLGDPNIQPLVELGERIFGIIYFITIILIIFFCLNRDKKQHVSKNYVLIFVLLAFIIANLLDHDTRLVTVGWPGFDIKDLVIAFVITYFIYNIAIYRIFIKNVNFYIVLFMLSVSIIPLFSFVLRANKIYDPYHSQFVLDEIMSWSANSIPGVNYASQYSNLLGLPLWLFSSIFNFQEHILGASVAYIAVLQVLIYCFLYFQLKKVTSSLLFPNVLFLFILSSFYIGFYLPDAMVGANYWGNFPLRYLGPTLIGLLLVYLNFRSQKKGGALSSDVIFGISLGLVLYNNLDWGVPSLIGGMLAFVLIVKYDLKRIIRLTLSILFTLASIIMISNLMYSQGRNSWSLDRFTLLSQIFGGEYFYAYPMNIFGLHWIFIFVYISSAIFGTLNWKIHESKASLLLVYWSIVSSGCFLYFVNRSLQPLLGSLMIFLSICLALIIYINYENRDSYGIRKQEFIYIFLGILLVISGVRYQPDVNQWVDTYRKRNVQIFTAEYSDVSSLIRNTSLERVAYIGIQGSLISAKLGIINLTGVNNPSSIVAFKQVDLICQNIQLTQVDTIYYYMNTFESARERIQDCLSKYKYKIKDQNQLVKVYTNDK
jgi:hypothetical protein